MSPKTARLIGLLFLAGAAAAAVLNLRRVADLGVPWLAPALTVVGTAFFTFAARSGGR